MADISQGIDAYFWLSLSTLFCTSIGLIIRYAYRSKCSSVSCCCLKITRDIETEEKENTKEDVFKILIGNKIDKKEREVEYEEGFKLAKENNMTFFETSSKYVKNISFIFDYIVQIYFILYFYQLLLY